MVSTKKRPASSDLHPEQAPKRRDIDTSVESESPQMEDDDVPTEKSTPRTHSASNGDDSNSVGAAASTSASVGDERSTNSSANSNGHSHIHSQAKANGSSTSQRVQKPASDRLIVFDTTLRDGEQSPHVFLSRDQKLEILRGMVRLGVGAFSVFLGFFEHCFSQ